MEPVGKQGLQVANPVARDAGRGVGPLLRDWRARRRCSQMDLALDAGVSPRHLSFIETGRARPSPALLLALADRLDVPLRERNRLLLAAGYAPRYGERPLDDAGMAHVRVALERLLAAHEPFPGLVLDRHWNVVLANRAAQRLTALLSPALTVPTLNIFRASLHPQGLAARTENFVEWAKYLLSALERAVATSGDAALMDLQREILGYANVQALARQHTLETASEPSLLVPCVLALPAGRLSMFTTLTAFGTPRDITLDELAIELFYPSDDTSERMLRALEHGAAPAIGGR